MHEILIELGGKLLVAIPLTMMIITFHIIIQAVLFRLFPNIKDSDSSHDIASIISTYIIVFFMLVFFYNGDV